MILKKIKIEHTDKKTGMVLKRIATSEWETHNHKIAVNNSLFNCEKSRVENKKPILPAHFQIYHIFHNKKKRIWKIEEMDADHVSAWSKGGATDIKNCEMLCKTHNRAKGNK